MVIFSVEICTLCWDRAIGMFFLNMRCSSIVALSEQDVRGLWNEVDLGQEQCV